MGNETKKSHARRNANGDYERFFKGNGIDIGCGDYALPFTDVVKFDKIYGNDAHDLSMFPNYHFDYVYSSHCLEHLENPVKAVKEWWRVLKHGGHMIIVVPEFSLYEKRNIPSLYNSDHKTFWTLDSLYKRITRDYGIFGFQTMRVQVNDQGFDYLDKKNDQTINGAQAEVEIVLRKVFDSFWEDYLPVNEPQEKVEKEINDEDDRKIDTDKRTDDRFFSFRSQNGNEPGPGEAE